MNGFGEPYLYIGCLTKPELDSLNDQLPNGFVTDNVAKFKAEYASAVRNGSSKARQPTLNLLTGCFEGQDRILLGPHKACPTGFDPFQETFFSAGVLRKIEQVLTAYHAQWATDREVSRPRYAPSMEYDYIPPPVIIL